MRRIQSENFGFYTFLAGVLICLVPLEGSAQTPTPTAVSGPVQYVLEATQGTSVQVLEKGTDRWEAGEEGEVLRAGDEIKTGPDSEATLMLQSDNSIHLDSGSDMKIDQISNNHQGGFFSRLGVEAGGILADVRKHLEESHSTFEVAAGGVVCGVRGTAFEVEANGDEVQTLTHEGTVDVKTDGQDELVRSGNEFTFRKGRFLSRRRLDRKEISRFAKWRAYRVHVYEKRRQRLEDIRRGARHPWVRRALRHRRRAVR